MREWSFPCPNYNAIHNQLCKEEQDLYMTQVAHLDKTAYMHTAVEGGRLYCLKEDPRKMTLNRSYHNFLFVLDLTLKILFWCLVLSFIASWFKPVRDVFSYGEPVVKHVPFLGAAVFNEK
ncbi:hypothetical protein MSG28_001073 [Choristoneura fumiferana]|uniref:Uncharacterized protein n=3 Tax=Choristoneura fumiferana TaxID=7141 RepID=A0ACC0K3H2_CHOFU|nr:hypothetical protein MSG28_001073 [Choristoneura fumiferana]